MALMDLISKIPSKDIAAAVPQAVAPTRLVSLFAKNERVVQATQVRAASLFQGTRPLPAVYPGNPAVVEEAYADLTAYSLPLFSVKKTWIPSELRALETLTAAQLTELMTAEATNLTQNLVYTQEVLLAKALRSGSITHRIEGSGTLNITFGTIPTLSAPLSGPALDWVRNVRNALLDAGFVRPMVLMSAGLRSYLMSDSEVQNYLTGHSEFLGQGAFEIDGVVFVPFAGGVHDENGDPLPYIPSGVHGIVVEERSVVPVFGLTETLKVQTTKYAVQTYLSNTDPERLDLVVQMRYLPVLASQETDSGRVVRGVVHITD